MRSFSSVLFHLLAVVLGLVIAYNLVFIPSQFDVVVIAALLLFYPVVRYPRLGVYIFFLTGPLIPFFRKLYYLLYQRPSADPLIILGDILVVFIFAGLFFQLRPHLEQDKQTRFFSRSIFLYLVYVVVRAFVLNNSPLTAAAMNLRFYAPQTLFFFVGIVYAHNFRMLKKLWVITLVMGIFAALYGFNQLFFGYSEAERVWFSSISFTSLFIEGMARPFSFFQSPAAFADYLQLAIIAVLILYAWSSSVQSKLLFSLIPFFFYGILITSVRSNWAGMIVSVLVWLSVLVVRGTKQRVAVFSLLLMGYFGIQFLEGASEDWGLYQGLAGGQNVESVQGDFVSALVTDRMGALINPFTEHSVRSRFALWRYVFRTSFSPVYAVLGRGTGTFNSDSLYVNYLAEFGYPGMAFIILLTLAFIAKGLYILDNADNRAVVALVKGITALNITFAVINLTGTHIHSFPGDSYFWFWNGVLIKLAALSYCKTEGGKSI